MTPSSRPRVLPPDVERPDRLIAGIAGGVALLLLAVSTRYGWHRDELYFLEVGKHLAWGYIDQPPFTPFVARVADTVAPGNLAVLRTLPALATAMTIVLGSRIVGELGGDGRARVAGAAAVAAGGFALGVGHLLSTAAFDLTWWMALLWIVARLLRTADARWWLAFGAVAGVAMMNKNLVVLLAIAVSVGLLVERRWRLLLSPWTVAGATLALCLAAPNLLWQAHHGWPQLDMARALSDRLGLVNRVTLLPLQLLFVGPAFVVVLWRGAHSLAHDEAARPFRPFLWAWPAGIVVAFVTAGRPYYVLPLTIVVLLTGVVDVARRGRMRGLALLIVANALVSVPLSLPVLPVSTANVPAAVNEAVAETVGWPQLADQLARVVRGLPDADRDHVMLLAGSYGEAGAIDRFGASRGLPPAFSPHNSYADLREPTDDTATVVAVRFTPDYLRRFFESCDQVATVDNGLGIDNEVQGQPIVVCRGLRGTWAEIWPKLRFLA